MKEKTGLSGKFKLELVSPEGTIKAVREIPNTIMNTGLAEMSGLLLSDVGGNAFDHLALGEDNTAPNATQSSLISEAYRTGGDGTQETTAQTDDTAQLSGSFSITSSVTLQEAGIFNSSSGGVMLARTTYSSISASNGDTVNAVYKVQFS